MPKTTRSGIDAAKRRAKSPLPHPRSRIRVCGLLRAASNCSTCHSIQRSCGTFFSRRYARRTSDSAAGKSAGRPFSGSRAPCKQALMRDSGARRVESSTRQSVSDHRAPTPSRKPSSVAENRGGRWLRTHPLRILADSCLARLAAVVKAGSSQSKQTSRTSSSACMPPVSLSAC